MDTRSNFTTTPTYFTVLIHFTYVQTLYFTLENFFPGMSISINCNSGPQLQHDFQEVFNLGFSAIYLKLCLSILLVDDETRSQNNNNNNNNKG